MPKNLGSYNNDLSVPRKKDIDDLANVVDGKYSASNPPPYPVTSVNGKTGAVTVEAELPDGLVKYAPISSVQSVDVLDADTLQGHDAAYFAPQAYATFLAERIEGVDTSVSSLQDDMAQMKMEVPAALQSKLPIAGGTMTGALVAQTNTNYTTRQVRNVIISTAEPSGGYNGDIWIRYSE